MYLQKDLEVFEVIANSALRVVNFMSTTTDLKDPQTQPLKTCGCIRVGKSSKLQQRRS